MQEDCLILAWVSRQSKWQRSDGLEPDYEKCFSRVSKHICLVHRNQPKQWRKAVDSLWGVWGMMPSHCIHCRSMSPCQQQDKRHFIKTASCNIARMRCFTSHSIVSNSFSRINQWSTHVFQQPERSIADKPDVLRLLLAKLDPHRLTVTCQQSIHIKAFRKFPIHFEQPVY